MKTDLLSPSNKTRKDFNGKTIELGDYSKKNMII